MEKLRCLTEEEIMKHKDERGTTSVSVRLPDDLIVWIDEQAEQERRSRGSFIKNALEDLRKALER